MVLSNVQLFSEVDIDYTRLKDLLAQGEWKAASRGDGSLICTQERDHGFEISRSLAIA